MVTVPFFCFFFTLDSGEVITATSNHPFWTINTQNWTEAGQLNVETVLWNINDKNSTISSLRSYTKKATVYNLTVDNDHTYFVGVGEVLGHNSDDCDPKELARLLRSAKQAKKMPDKDLDEYMGIPGWHKNKKNKEQYLIDYYKKLKGSSNFDFYWNKRTGDLFIKGNQSKEIIPIGEIFK